MTKKLKIGVIGIGWFALGTLVPNFKEIDGVEITAIARRNPERLKLAQTIANVPNAYTDWREMLDKESLDAIVVSTPHDFHTEPTLAALERNLHVFLEKPMAITSQDAYKMTKAAADSNRVLTIGYNNRGKPGWRAIKRMLDEDAIGTIRQINIVTHLDARIFWDESLIPETLKAMFEEPKPDTQFFADAFSAGNWRSKPDQMGGGMFIDGGTHIVDIMLWLGGAAPIEVMAYTNTENSIVDTKVSCVGKLANNATFSIMYNDAVSNVDDPIMSRGYFAILGDSGSIIADWKGYILPDPDEIWLEREGKREKIELSDDIITPAQGFVATIRENAPNFAPPHEAAQAVALTEAIYRSSADQRLIQVAQP